MNSIRNGITPFSQHPHNVQLISARALTFKLYGPGDATCKTVIATKMVTVSGNGTYASGNVLAADAGVYNWVASYSGDANNNAVASKCGSESVTVTPQIMTGRAFGVSLNGLLSVSAIPDTGPVTTTVASSTAMPCKEDAGGSGLLTVLTAHLLCANVTTTLGPAHSQATASVADVTLGSMVIPVIHIGAAQSQSDTTCAGSSGSATIASLSIGSTVILPSPSTVNPNTAINLGVIDIVLNEQIPITGAEKGLTVNAAHITIPGILDLIVASSESDIGNCP